MSTTLKFGAGKWAAKEGSVLAYNDLNNNFKPLPFTFTRASSATRVNESGLIESVGSGIPRVDFLNNADGHLLLEPSRTNVYPYSNFYGTGGLDSFLAGTSTSTVTNNYAISPDGTQNAIRFEATVGSTSSDRAGLRDLLSVSAVDSTISFYGKSNTGSNQVIGIQFIGGTQTTVTLTNEWQRFEYTGLSNTSNYCGIEIRGTITDLSVDVLLYGFQFEAGSYATSYIPTSGSSVTRVVDDIELAFPSTSSFSSNSGFTSVVEFGVGGRSGSSSSPFLQINDADGYMSYGSSGGSWRCRLQIGATAYLNTATNTSRDSVAKLGISCDSNGWSQCANGEVYASGANDASSLNVLSTITFLTNETYGQIKIRSLGIYNTRLSDSELEFLTSI